MKDRNSEYAMVAHSLVEFFKNHRHDPNNALIGLKPNIEMFNNYYEQTADGKKYRLPRNVEIIREKPVFLDVNSPGMS